MYFAAYNFYWLVAVGQFWKVTAPLKVIIVLLAKDLLALLLDALQLLQGVVGLVVVVPDVVVIPGIHLRDLIIQIRNVILVFFCSLCNFLLDTRGL